MAGKDDGCELLNNKCSYCEFESGRPWELISHLVEVHSVVLSHISVGGVAIPYIETQTSLCLECGYTSATVDSELKTKHELFYHFLTSHHKQLFGKHSTTKTCVFEMVGSCDRSLVLSVRNKVRTATSSSVVDRSTRSHYVASQNSAAINSKESGVGKVMFVQKFVSSLEDDTIEDAPLFDSVVDHNFFFEGAAMDPDSVDFCSTSSGRCLEEDVENPPALVLDLSNDQIEKCGELLTYHRKGFQCRICSRTSSSREAAIYHVYRLHLCSGKQRFPCHLCKKAYDNAANLQMHVDLVHLKRGRQHKCPNCPMRYCYPGDLRRHLSKNSCFKFKNVVYECRKCGVQWFHPSAVRSHERQCTENMSSNNTVIAPLPSPSDILLELADIP